MIELNNVNKVFEQYNQFLFNKGMPVKILKDISFKVNKSDVIGVIGKNGSGKTTLLKLLFGSLLPDSGSIKWTEPEAKSSFKTKSFASINNNDRSFFWRLSLSENIDYFSGLYGKKSNKLIEPLLKNLKVDSFKDRPFYTLSAGQKKKAMLYRALIKDPEIILFDEFTTALDLPSKKDIERYTKDILITKFKKTIFWVTHNLDEIFSLCNKLIVIEDGKIVKFLTVNDLTNKEIEEITDILLR